MIITLSGNVGGGKTLTMIHMAHKENQHKKVLHNIRGMREDCIQNQHLLTKANLFCSIKDEKKSTSRTDVYKLIANWEFLKANAGCTYMLDEAHELFYSRNFSSQQSKVGSMIFAQIRKLCMDSGNFSNLDLIRRLGTHMFTSLIYEQLAMHNNAYVTSQTTSKLEKDIRDLSQVHIHCHSRHIGEHMFVYNDFYFMDSKSNALEKFEGGYCKPKTAFFYANNYFEMYDRFAIIDMDSEML